MSTLRRSPPRIARPRLTQLGPRDRAAAWHLSGVAPGAQLRVSPDGRYGALFGGATAEPSTVHFLVFAELRALDSLDLGARVCDLEFVGPERALALCDDGRRCLVSLPDAGVEQVAHGSARHRYLARCEDPHRVLVWGGDDLAAGHWELVDGLTLDLRWRLDLACFGGADPLGLYPQLSPDGASLAVAAEAPQRPAAWAPMVIFDTVSNQRTEAACALEGWSFVFHEDGLVGGFAACGVAGDGAYVWLTPDGAVGGSYSPPVPAGSPLRQVLQRAPGLVWFVPGPENTMLRFDPREGAPASYAVDALRPDRAGTAALEALDDGSALGITLDGARCTLRRAALGATEVYDWVAFDGPSIAIAPAMMVPRGGGVFELATPGERPERVLVRLAAPPGSWR